MEKVPRKYSQAQFSNIKIEWADEETPDPPSYGRRELSANYMRN